MNYKELYEENEGDTTSKGLCCANQKLHDDRLIQVASEISQICYPALDKSVLDVGCGFGDLCLYLPKDLEYMGVDGVEWIAEEAARRYPHHEFVHGEAKDVGDDSFTCVVALGVLATMEQYEVEPFLNTLAGKANDALILSWQDSAQYKGNFKGYNLNDIEYAIGCRVHKTMQLEGDTEVTGVWTRF